MLTAWPFRAPRHGGQLRAAAIAQAYRDAGHTVFSAALYDPADSTAEFWPDHVPITAEISRAMRPAAGEPDGEASTMVFWQAVAAARRSFRAYADVVRAAQPDVVQIEEPVLLPVVRRLRARACSATRPSPIRHTISRQLHANPGVTLARRSATPPCATWQSWNARSLARSTLSSPSPRTMPKLFGHLAPPRSWSRQIAARRRHASTPISSAPTFRRVRLTQCL